MTRPINRPKLADIMQAMPPDAFSFNPRKNRWFHNGAHILDEDMLIFLIDRAKELNIPAPGDWAPRALAIARNEPAYTMGTFLKLATRKNRGQRVRGRDVLLRWLLLRGEDYTDCSEKEFAHFIQQFGALAGRFYDALANAGYKIRGVARIAGKKGVWSNVVEGLSLVSIDTSNDHFEADAECHDLTDIFADFDRIKEEERQQRAMDLKIFMWELFLDELETKYN